MRKHSSDVPGKTWEEKLDLPLLKYLSEVIIMNDPLEGCIRKGRITDWDELPESKSLFHSPEGCGLPIGNLTSQLFSNIYMNRLDQYMKRVLKCSAYGRYVDDFYVVSQHKSSLPLYLVYFHYELILMKIMPISFNGIVILRLILLFFTRFQ